MDGKRILGLVGLCVIILLGITEQRRAVLARREVPANESENADETARPGAAPYVKICSGECVENVDSLFFRAANYLHLKTVWLTVIPPQLLCFAGAFLLVAIAIAWWLLNP